MLTLNKTEELELKLELARIDFWSYCQLKYPRQYTNERQYLKQVCNGIQNFIEQDEKKFLVLTMPPRHRKSFTATSLTEWLFGIDNTNKVMTGSYNENLSTTFATKVRDIILEKGDPVEGYVYYKDIFPNTKVKYGEASKSYWALEGSTEKNYLATSPTGTATGIGARYIIIDDVIKNDKEAYNEMVKEGHWQWLTNTMMQRTEGDDFKVIIIMTRWATDDLAGRVIEEYGELVEHISFSAVQEDGTMLDPTVLTPRNYEIKTRNMNPDIVEANYNQKPIDIKGRLYNDFMTYEELPEGAKDLPTHNYTDTADKGTDYLCSVSYKVFQDQVYITGVVMSDEDMETTEPLVVDMFHELQVDDATIESNNGGRGYRRNIQRLLKEKYNYIKCVFTDKTQTSNKEARILASSAWVQNNVYMPHNWKQKFGKDFKDQLLKYQKKGKNEHDDAPDALAGIYEAVTDTKRVQILSGLNTRRRSTTLKRRGL